MQKVYDLTSRELAVIGPKLVDCLDARETHHRFYLRLDDGPQHESFHSFNKEWQSRKASLMRDIEPDQAVPGTLPGASQVWQSYF